MKRYILLIALVTFLLFLLGCETKSALMDEPDPVPVRVGFAIEGPISEEGGFSGEVTAVREVQVVPKTAGRVAKVAVQMGQEVKKGDLLVRLEADELAVMLRQAEAGVEMARASLRNAQSGSAKAQLEAAVEQSMANFEAVQGNLERMEYLYNEGAISLQQLEGVRLQFKVAESQYNLTLEQLGMFERGEGQLEVLQAQVKQTEAALEMARLNYNNSSILAPVGGVVSLLNTGVGNMVSPGVPVATIVDLTEPQVMVRMTERAVAVLTPGMPVEVEVPSLSAIFAGEIKEVSPGTVAGSRSFLVRVRLFEADKVSPGMFARVRLAISSKDNAILVPRVAILEREGSFYAFTVEEARAVRREVELGLTDEKYAEVLFGFAPGEAVVVSGQHFLRDGSPLMVEAGEAW